MFRTPEKEENKMMMPGTGHRKLGTMSLFEIESKESRRGILALPYDDLIKRDLSGKDLTFADLRGCDMSFSILSSSELTNADLSGSNLTGVNLEGCAVIGCEFDGANLTGAIGIDKLRPDDTGRSGFYRSSWAHCDFTGVDLSWVDAHEIESPKEFFKSCKGLPDGFIESLVRKKKGMSAFGM